MYDGYITKQGSSGGGCMKVYALLVKTSVDGPRLPTAIHLNDAVSFTQEEFKPYTDLFPDLWVVYELELDEKDLCAM